MISYNLYIFLEKRFYLLYLHVIFAKSFKSNVSVLDHQHISNISNYHVFFEVSTIELIQKTAYIEQGFKNCHS